MSADALLDKLDKVKQNGPGRWVACCPAHPDRTPSLSIREGDDGRVLVHCFAGCEVAEVLAAVALEFDALFPPRPIEDGKPVRRMYFNAHDVLECLAHESLVVAMASSSMQQGEPFTQETHDRLILAASRIESARSLANGC